MTKSRLPLRRRRCEMLIARAPVGLARNTRAHALVTVARIAHARADVGLNQNAAGMTPSITAAALIATIIHTAPIVGVR
jgi:hypothetical protein